MPGSGQRSLHAAPRTCIRGTRTTTRTIITTRSHADYAPWHRSAHTSIARRRAARSLSQHLDDRRCPHRTRARALAPAAGTDASPVTGEPARLGISGCSPAQFALGCCSRRIALHRVIFRMRLVFAFSVGLAATLRHGCLPLRVSGDEAPAGFASGRLCDFCRSSAHSSSVRPGRVICYEALVSWGHLLRAARAPGRAGDAAA